MVLFISGDGASIHLQLAGTCLDGNIRKQQNSESSGLLKVSMGVT